MFGGRSAEHEVSLNSARNVIEALDKTKYEPVLIGIDKNGRWHLNDSSKFLLAGSQQPETAIAASSIGDDVVLLPATKEGQGDLLSARSSAGKALAGVDVVFPILHGPFGEDGTVQGLLKLANVPFVGAGVLGSAVGMDKDVMKRLLRDAGLPVSDFMVVTTGTRKDFDIDAAIARLKLPIFVKPANLGSSVGISKAKDKKGLQAAIDLAFRYDRKIVLEEFVPCREIECAVLGNDTPIASVPGEIITGSQHEFYSYEAKYLDNEGQRIEIPANLPKEVSDKVRVLAVQAFQVLCCEGLARVDFFVTPDWKIYLNEINTLPGFTNISMYPKLFEATGIRYSDLIDKIIQLGLERFAAEQVIETNR